MNLLKSISVYTLTNIINSGISFFLLPVFTHYLNPTDYGNLSLITVLTSLFLPVIHLSVHGAIQVEYFKLSYEKFGQFLSTALSNVVFSFLIVLSMLLLGGHYLAEWLNFSHFWLLMVPVIALVQIIPQVIQSFFQIRKEAFNYSVYTLSLAIVNISLGLILVVVLKMSWEGRVISRLLTFLIFTVVGLYVLYRKSLLRINLDKGFRRSALNFGIPLIPHLIGSIIVDASDRLFINHMVNVEELGIYNVGYQVGMLIAILQHSFSLAYTPVLLENLNVGKTENKLKIVRISYILIGALFFFLLILDLLSPLFFDLFIDEAFAKGIDFVFWVGLGYVFLGMYKLVTGFIFYLKKTKILAYISIFNIVANLIFNYFFILHFGSIGAAYATCLSFFLLFLIVAIISYRLYPMPWFSFKKIFDFSPKK